MTKGFDAVIFVEYNSVFYKNQLDLIEKIETPVLLISTGVSCVFNEITKIDSLVKSYCLKKPSIRALAQVIKGN